MKYHVPLRYALIMLILLVATGGWMFVLHTSVTIDGVMAYYAPKTFYGLLETVAPHLFGMGIVVFILTHFFAVIKGVAKEYYRGFSILFFSFMLLTNLTGFWITEGSLYLSLCKLVSTVLFVLYTLIASYKLFKVS